MSDEDPLGDGNPFGNVPFFGDLMRLLGQQAGDGWDAARQIAVQIATDGRTEPNVEPTTRIAVEQLARVAELRALDATGLPGASPRLTVVTRSQWATQTLADYRPHFEALGSSMGNTVLGAPDEADTDPAAAMMANLMQMLGPMMLGMMAGTMVGHLAGRAFGSYELLLPRSEDHEILLVSAAIDEFGEEWSLDLDELRLWVCLSESCTHLVLSVPHVRETLALLLAEYVDGFQADDRAIESKLGELELSQPDDLQKLFGDPEVALGLFQSDRQRELLPRLHGLLAVIAGYVDHVMDGIGAELISSYDQITEAMRRRRVEAGPADHFVERLLGIELDQATYDRGAAFVDGVVERAGDEGLARLWVSARELPTPNELDAPGLWLARIDLPDDPA